MKYTCTHCNLTSADGNLWCQRLDCSTLNMTPVFRGGDLVGDFKIIKPLRVMRTATVYEATRLDVPLIVKISHYDTDEALRSGRGYGVYLKNEAATLGLLQKSGVNHIALPKVVLPYTYTNDGSSFYGRMVINDQLRYYMVFEHVEGQFLRDYLANHPQPFHQQAGWITETLADLMATFHIKLKRLHLSLSPDNIFIRTDKEGILRPLLFDFGFYGNTYPAEVSKVRGQESQNDYYNWLSLYLHPAYISPEMFLEAETRTQRADVYNLGLVLYEMLAGRPLYEYKTQSESMIRINILDKKPPRRLGRIDLSPDLNEFVESCVSKEQNERPRNMETFSQKLHSLFGMSPPEKRTRANSPLLVWFSENYVMVGSLLILFVIGLLVILGGLEVLS